MSTRSQNESAAQPKRTSELQTIDLREPEPTHSTEPYGTGIFQFESEPYRPWYQRGLIVALVIFSLLATVIYVMFFSEEPEVLSVFDDSALVAAVNEPVPAAPTFQRASTLSRPAAEDISTTTEVVEEVATTQVLISTTETTIAELVEVAPPTTDIAYIALPIPTTSSTAVASTSSIPTTPVAPPTTAAPTTVLQTFVTVPFKVTSEVPGKNGEYVSRLVARGKSDALRFKVEFENCLPGQTVKFWLFGDGLEFTNIGEVDCSAPAVVEVANLAPGTEYGLRIRVNSTWIFRASVTTLQ